MRFPSPRPMPSMVSYGQAPEREPLLPTQLPTQHKFKSLCVLFFGRRGDGKSLGMTNFLKMQQDRMKASHFPWQVLTNYACKFAKADPYMVEYLATLNQDIRNGEIGLDEVQNNFPSRRSLTRANVDFGGFATSVRKRHLNLWMTTQFPTMLDTWILMQVDLFVRCNIFAGGRGIHFRVYDYWGLYTGNDARKPWPPRPDEFDWEFNLGGADVCWPLYDTDEVVPSIWSQYRDNVIEEGGHYNKTEEPAAPGTGEPETQAPEVVSLEPAEMARRSERQFLGIIQTRSQHGKFDVLGLLPSAQRLLPKEIPAGKGKNALYRLCEWLIEHDYQVDPVDNGRSFTGKQKL